MKLIDETWSHVLHTFFRTWLADNESEVTAGFDPDSAEGSMILVISTNATYMKNTQGKWQKCGTTEVVG